MEYTVQVQIRFIVESSKYGDFHSSLYYTPEEWVDITPEIIKVSAQALFDDYVFQLQNAVATAEPTLPELLSEKANLEAQLASVNQKIAERS